MCSTFWIVADCWAPASFPLTLRNAQTRPHDLTPNPAAEHALRNHPQHPRGLRLNSCAGGGLVLGSEWRVGSQPRPCQLPLMPQPRSTAVS